MTRESIRRLIIEDKSAFQKNAHRSLGMMGGVVLAPLTEVIDDWSRSFDPSTLMAATLASASWQSIARRFPDEAKGLLNGNDSVIKAVAARLIGEYRLAQFTMPVIELLAKSDEPFVIAESALALGRIIGQFASGSTISAVHEGHGHYLGLEERIDVGRLNERICCIITGAPEKQTEISSFDSQSMSDYRRSTFELTRQSGILAAGEAGTEVAIPMLIEILGQSGPDVAAAILSLGKLRSVDAIPIMARLLNGYVHSSLLAAIAESLGAIGSPVGLELLTVLAGDSESRVRMSVCEALGLVGSNDCKAVLSVLCKDLDPDVRSAARKALYKAYRVRH